MQLYTSRCLRCYETCFELRTQSSETISTYTIICKCKTNVKNKHLILKELCVFILINIDLVSIWCCCLYKRKKCVLSTKSEKRFVTLGLAKHLFKSAHRNRKQCHLWNCSESYRENRLNRTLKIRIVYIECFTNDCETHVNSATNSSYGSCLWHCWPAFGNHFCWNPQIAINVRPV